MASIKQLLLPVVTSAISMENNSIKSLANEHQKYPHQKECFQYTNVTENHDPLETSLIKTKLIATSLCAQKKPKYVWYRFSYPLNVPFSFESTVGVHEFFDSPEKISCSRNNAPDHPCQVHDTITSKLCFQVNNEITVGRTVTITLCGSFYMYQLLQFPCKGDTPNLQRLMKTVPPDRTCNVSTKGKQ